MKLTEAIGFATENPQFLQLLQQNNIGIDSANGISASIVHDDNNAIWIEIIVDYGYTGPGSNDVRIRIHFDKAPGNFIFDNVAVRH